MTSMTQKLKTKLVYRPPLPSIVQEILMKYSQVMIYLPLLSLSWCFLLCFVLLLVPQVARLVEMGFSRIDALEALRASNNDINMATNFLLQHWGRARERETESKLSEKKNKRWMRTERGSRKRSNQSRGAKRNDDGDKMLEKMTVSDGD